MPRLNDAMAQQIIRMTNSDEPVPVPDNAEIRNLLEAFISLINAYLKRVGSNPEEEPRRFPRPSDTFGSLG